MFYIWDSAEISLCSCKTFGCDFLMLRRGGGKSNHPAAGAAPLQRRGMRK